MTGGKVEFRTLTIRLVRHTRNHKGPGDSRKRALGHGNLSFTAEEVQASFAPSILFWGPQDFAE